MNNQNKKEEDIISQYIGIDSIEKAPEGFTERIMHRIHIEKLPQKRPANQLSANLIPWISSMVTIILILTALVLLQSNDHFLIPSLSEYIKNLNVLIPESNFFSSIHLSMPATILYIIIGILLLTIFDKALNSFFHRGN